MQDKVKKQKVGIRFTETRIYKGKEYKVVRHERVYRLLPYDEKIINSGLMKLEDAACDREGSLLIYK